MPIKDLGKEIKESVHGAVNAVQDKVKDIDVSEVKENVQNAAEIVKSKITETGDNAAGQMKKIFQKKKRN